jgi:hypothetical protein
MPAITFLKFKPSLASSRYRALIPERELLKNGFTHGKDIFICSKHGWPDELAKGYKKIVFDVCDDHFMTQHEPFYREWCKRADLITVNSKAMQDIVSRETNRDSVLIPDPYEQPEKRPRIHDMLLWYGHGSNIGDLERVLPSLTGHRIEIISNIKGFAQWTPENMNAAFNRAGIVIIPTGKSIAKSANRAIEAIRRGLYPVANPLPAYNDLGIWQGDIKEGVEWALSHKGEVMKRIASMQEYVRNEYSPHKIGKMWGDTLSSLTM